MRGSARWTAGAVNKANDESKGPPCPNVVLSGCGSRGIDRYRSGRSPNGKNFPLLVGQVSASRYRARIVPRRMSAWSSSRPVASRIQGSVRRSRAIPDIGGQALYESEVGFLVLAFVFQLRFRFRIDKSLYSCLVCKFLNDVRQGFVAP
mgnify:CR=1 FL=1